jgi:hypothetical protein
MTEEEMHWISQNLGPLLKAETRLSTKEAYLFATDFTKLLKLKWWGIDEFDKPGLDPTYSAIDELNTINPHTFKVSQEEWDKLNDYLNEPTTPSVVEGLKRLFGKNE